MKKLITLLLILIPFLGYSQIPPSEGPDLFGTRHFISLDGNDTLAISQGDTARITATDSIYIDKLMNDVGGVTDHGGLSGLDDPGDHTWAIEWSDTTDVVATQDYVDSNTGGETDPVYTGDYEVQSLSGDPYELNADNGHNAKIDLSQDTTILFTNLNPGTDGNITVSNTSSTHDIILDGYTFLIDSTMSSGGSKISASGDNEIDRIKWYYDGDYVFIDGYLGAPTWFLNEITELTYSGVNINAQGSLSLGLTFGDNGNKMYESDRDNDEIYQYTLSTAWDLSTASYDNVKIPSQDGSPSGLFFKPDGTKMYEIGSNGNLIYQYTLSTAWDISTATYDNIDVSTQDVASQDIFFKPDGTKMYEVGSSDDKIFQYTLSTAWDLSTATYDNIDYLTESVNPSGMHISPNGVELYVVGGTNEKVYQHTLSTAWDISTASYDNVNIDTQDTSPSAIFFKPDGTKMYELGHYADKIYQYTK